MKKSFKKLSLNKITIANLDASVMSQKVGGAKTKSDDTLLCPSLFHCDLSDLCGSNYCSGTCLSECWGNCHK